MSDKKYIFWLILILIVFALAEASAFIIGRYVLPPSIVFYPGFIVQPERMVQNYEHYLEVRDPVLGWPSKTTLADDADYDSSGSRINPLFSDPDLHSNCVSLYGDSYTWGSEVTYEFAPSVTLSRLLQCRVGNFGTGGFGSDQAFLKYLGNDKDKASVVFLNHLSENITRNIGQMRAIVGGYGQKAPTSFKPRFILDGDGALQLIDIPTVDSSDYPDLINNPGKYLPYEYFLPGGESGLVELKFPYTGYLLRTVFGHFHVAAEIMQRPWYMEFYDENHSSGGLQVTTAILSEFQTAALERGQTPIVTVIPTGLDLVYFRKHEIWPYQNLLDRLTENGVDVFNFGPGILAKAGDADPCTLFDDCSKHYNEIGYQYIGELAFDEMVRRGLAPIVEN